MLVFKSIYKSLLKVRGHLVINSRTALSSERFCLTSELTALQTKAPSRLREQGQAVAALATRLPLFSFLLQHPPDIFAELVTLVMSGCGLQ